MKIKNKLSVEIDEMTWFNIKIPTSLHDRLVDFLNNAPLPPSHEFSRRVLKWIEEYERKKPKKSPT